MPIPFTMSDSTSSPRPTTLPWRAGHVDDSVARGTEKLVRETWRHYYVAQLAEAQFGPTSIEASLARAMALEAYRELRASLRNLDPYYRAEPASSRPAPGSPPRLTLVKDDPPRPAEA